MLSVELGTLQVLSVKSLARNFIASGCLPAGLHLWSDVTTPCPEADLVADKDNKANYISASLYSGLLSTNPDSWSQPIPIIALKTNPKSILSLFSPENPPWLCDQDQTRSRPIIFSISLGLWTSFEIDDILSCSLMCTMCVLPPSPQAGLAPDKDKAGVSLGSGDQCWGSCEGFIFFSHKLYGNLKRSLFWIALRKETNLECRLVPKPEKFIGGIAWGNSSRI